MRNVIVGAIVVSGVLAACSSNSSQSTPAVVLRNGEVHYGKTYAEWGGAWWKWLYEIPQKSGAACITPDADLTGEACNLSQNGDVFFLAGNRGGTVVRAKCVVPNGKALFFPIITYTADNGGVPPDQQGTPEQNKAVVAAAVVKMKDVFLRVDGQSIDTTALRVDATEYSYTLPPEPNSYTCAGASGVVGLIAPCYHGGYYAMLSPLAPGPHTIEFGGTQSSFTLNVTYKLTVQ